MSGRKQGPNVLAPDAPTLCRIPAQGRQQVPIPHLEEETERQETHSNLLPNGNIFVGCFRTPRSTNLENPIGMIDMFQPNDAGGQVEGISRELDRAGHHQKI